MQVIEIKNDLVQVRYSTEEQAFSLGDFFVVSDNNADILAQIIHLETDEENALCLAKFILNINKDSSAALYNGYMPSLDSTISPVSKQEIIDFIAPVSGGIKVGTLVNSNLSVTLSESLLDTALYVQSDYAPACAKLLNKIFTENYTNNNVLFYDIDGTFNSYDMPKYELGKDIKIPLNSSFIDFIYNNDLETLTTSEKALVQDILLEIKDYIETTDKNFIEFSTILNVVESQYEERPCEALILFRNKLIEYKQLGYFADNQEEVETFYNAINTKFAVISAYKLAKNWQNALFAFCVENIKQKTHFIAQISDTSVDETLINTILASKYIIPIFVSDYSMKYRNVLRSKIPNMIFFQSIDELSDFPLYASFLNLLFDNTYIIWGEITSFLSVIASCEKPENNSYSTETANVSIQDTQEAEIDLASAETQSDDISNQDTQLETIVEEIKEPEILTQESEEAIFEPSIEEIEQLPVEEDNYENIEEIQSPQIEDEYSAEEIYSEANENTYEENVDTQTVEQNFDEILTEEEPQNDIPQIIEENPNEYQPVQEDIEDEDLDFLQEDDTNNIIFEDAEPEEEQQEINDNQQEFDTLYEEENDIQDYEPEDETLEDNTAQETYDISDNDIEQNETQEDPEPIAEPEFSVPVFQSEPQNNIEQNNDMSPSFVEGNIVYHEKYGRGIIEKVISYGAKTLCSIQFDNIGRRLLDPNLADLKHI